MSELAANKAINDWMRTHGRRPAERGVASEPPQHNHSDVAPLWRAREMAAQAGDEKSVSEINERLRRIDRDLPPPLPAIDAGARSSVEVHQAPDMNERIRSAGNYVRARSAGIDV